MLTWHGGKVATDPTCPDISYWITTEDLHENNNCQCQQVLPHWVKDCIMAETLLPLDDYKPSCFTSNNNLPSRSKSAKRKLEFVDDEEEFFSCHSDLSNSGSDSDIRLISTPKPKKRLKLEKLEKLDVL